MPKNIIIILIIISLNLNGIIYAQSLNINTSNEIFNNFENENHCVESEFSATGYIHLYEDENKVWWFIAPNGSKFYSEAIGYVTPSEFYYGDFSIWANQTDQLLKKMGVNTISPYRSSLSDYYYMVRFRFKQLSINHNISWSHDRTPDVFDPWWREQVKNATLTYATPLKNDPMLLGYYTDNEMKWGPDIDDDRTILEVYMAAENSTPGKQELIRFLRDDIYKNNTTLFNNVWNMSITNFSDLENYKEFGIKDAWRLRSSLNFEKNQLLDIYPKYRENASLMKQAEIDVRNFSRYVAKTYFNITNTYLKTADPNHLNIGTRFHLFGVPIEVLEECGKHVDVISINYYRSNINIYDPANCYISLKFGCVPLDNWMQRYYEKTNRPLFIGEWNMKLKDRVFPLYTEDDSFSSGRTQKNRADNFEWYAQNCLERSYMIGNSWFVFRDTGFGFGHGGYKGIVDLFDNRDEVLINRMQKVYTNSIEIHEKSSTNIKTQNYDVLNYFQNMNINNFYKDIFQDDVQLDYQDIRTLDSNNNRVQSIIDAKQEVNTIYVDDDSFYPGDGSKDWPYCKISFAIENATNSDTIRVNNGTYIEKIIINKPLSITGNDSSNTCISGFYEDEMFTSYNITELNNNVVTILSDNVKIQGFSIITGTGNYVDSSGNIKSCTGISIFNSTNCEIRDNLLTYTIGFKVRKSDRIIIENNNFTNNDIILDSSNNASINNNYMKSIWISRSKNCILKNNSILSGRDGIALVYSDDNKIEKNTIDKCKRRGVFLKNANNNVLEKNNFIPANNPISIFYLFDASRDSIYYESATFLNSKGNKWIGNYWGCGRVFPKIIVGRTGQDGLIPIINVDWSPAKEVN